MDPDLHIENNKPTDFEVELSEMPSPELSNCSGEGSSPEDLEPLKRHSR